MPNGEPDRAAIFQRERPQLLAVAFRILGSDADAQDVVQEAWIRYANADTAEVRNLPAWLSTIVTRLCVDLPRRRREDPRRPTGLPGSGGDGDTPERTDVAGPEELALLAGELTAARMVVLDQLTRRGGSPWCCTTSSACRSRTARVSWTPPPVRRRSWPAGHADNGEPSCFWATFSLPASRSCRTSVSRSPT